jgi:hypothetical protein
MADTIYTYTGKSFTTGVNGPVPESPYTTNDFVTGSITLANPLASNLKLELVTPISFSLTAGPLTTTDTSTPYSFALAFSTDASGNIIGWALYTYNYLTPATPDGAIFVDAHLNSSNVLVGGDSASFNTGTETDPAYVGGQSATPGTWTVSNTSAVPEPSTLFLMGTGAIGVIGSFRRQQQIS